MPDCLTCLNLDSPAKTPQHAAVGMGRCKLAKPGRFEVLGRAIQCGKFKAAGEDTAGPRVAWFAKLN